VSFNTDGSTFVTVDVVGPSRIPPRPDKWRAIGGNIRIDGDTLTFSDIRTTLVACANTRNFTGLGGTDHFRVTGNHLVLTAGDGTEFHFHPARFPADDNVVRVTGNGKSKVLDDGAAFIYAVENAAPIHSQARTTELGPTYEILFSTSPSAAPDVIVDVHDYGCKTATIGSTTFDGRVIAQLARKALA
jgi:hypothetical protein